MFGFSVELCNQEKFNLLQFLLILQGKQVFVRQRLVVQHQGYGVTASRKVCVPAKHLVANQ